MIRTCIKPYLEPYLDIVGARIGTTDRTEIVNHIIRNAREGEAAGVTTLATPLVKQQQQPEDDHLADSLLECVLE